MSNKRLNQIGIDRIIRFSWLEKTASLGLAGNGVKEIKAILLEDLKKAFRSEKVVPRGALDKTLTILLKVWLIPPKELESLQMEGLELLKSVPQRCHLAVHWGMIMAVYPFWSGVAAHFGRLMKLQGSAAAAHIQRRVREQYGERETVSRAAQRILRSFLDWGVLQESDAKGVYTPCPSLIVDDPQLIAWLVEALLRSRKGNSYPLKDMIYSPGLFPFRLKAIHAENLTSSSNRLDILRHGLDDEMVMLRK